MTKFKVIIWFAVSAQVHSFDNNYVYFHLRVHGGDSGSRILVRNKYNGQFYLLAMLQGRYSGRNYKPETDTSEFCPEYYHGVFVYPGLRLLHERFEVDDLDLDIPRTRPDRQLSDPSGFQPHTRDSGVSTGGLMAPEEWSCIYAPPKTPRCYSGPYI